MEQETERILQKIRATRLEKKISLLNLDTGAGISHSHLYYIESKKVIPSVDVLVKIAKALRIEARDLFD